MTALVLADAPWKVSHGLHPTYVEHNNGPLGPGAVYRAAEAEMYAFAVSGQLWAPPAKLPFPFVDEDRLAYAHALSVATRLGFERRPGGPSGLAFDLVMLERTGAPAVDDTPDEIRWAA